MKIPLSIGQNRMLFVLWRFAIVYATSAMSRFNISPREGQLNAVKRVQAYLKIDAAYSDHFIYPVEDFVKMERFSIQMLKRKPK
jgi:hypothetical protein